MNTTGATHVPLRNSVRSIRAIVIRTLWHNTPPALVPSKDERSASDNIDLKFRATRADRHIIPLKVEAHLPWYHKILEGLRRERINLPAIIARFTN